jgi:tetratricopeptide (TPR) repeat protein
MPTGATPTHQDHRKIAAVSGQATTPGKSIRATCIPRSTPWLGATARNPQNASGEQAWACPEAAGSDPSSGRPAGRSFNVIESALLALNLYEAHYDWPNPGPGSIDTAKHLEPLPKVWRPCQRLGPAKVAASSTATFMSQLAALKPSILNTIASAYRQLGDITESLNYYRKQEQACQALGDRFEAAQAIIGIGVVYYDIGDHANFLLYSERALSVFQELGEKYWIGLTLNNICYALFKLHLESLARTGLELMDG